MEKEKEKKRVAEVKQGGVKRGSIVGTVAVNILYDALPTVNIIKKSSVELTGRDIARARRAVRTAWRTYKYDRLMQLKKLSEGKKEEK